MKRQTDDKQFLDPVFLRYGQEVYTNDFAQSIREDVLERKKQGKRLANLIPQEGFQETVCTQDADLLIVGGRKGGGKSWVALFMAMRNMFNPDVALYAFRKYEDDVRRGPWK